MDDPETRLRALVEAGIALGSEPSLDTLLQRLTRTAAELTGARYAALGVIDPTGDALERFVTHGLTDEERAAIGPSPRGHGILGVLIREATPLQARRHRRTTRDRSASRRGHPPMRSFLGVPILMRGTAYGNLYLTEKQGEAQFGDEDEEIATLLAAQAAVAIENTRLYESATRWLRQLESLDEIGNALTAELDLPRLLSLIAARFRELVGARLVLIALPVGATLRVEAADGEGTEAARRAPARSRLVEGRPGASSSARASWSTRWPTIPRSIRQPRSGSDCAPRCTSRSSPVIG